jgi:alkanesulfonate monooxygenase SsuD/methylene tetrahydromethanopterin reductase-like flavin-dependent oxidoreductase (luciferase family)
VILGIGSGWLKEEFDALGLDFRARGARTDEAIQAMRAAWREPVASYHGKHFHFHNVKSYPKPAQPAGVPIHVGGHSPAAARRAGRFGDGFFPTITDPAKLREIFATVRDEARKAGRNPEAIEFSAMAAPKPDSLRALRDAGVSRVVFGPPSSDPAKLKSALERMANDVAHI